MWLAPFPRKGVVPIAELTAEAPSRKDIWLLDVASGPVGGCGRFGYRIQWCCRVNGAERKLDSGGPPGYDCSRWRRGVR